MLQHPCLGLGYEGLDVVLGIETSVALGTRRAGSRLKYEQLRLLFLLQRLAFAAARLSRFERGYAG